MSEREGGEVEVTVHQVVRDKTGTVVANHEVRHVYIFDEDLVRRMDIET